MVLGSLRGGNQAERLPVVSYLIQQTNNLIEIDGWKKAAHESSLNLKTCMTVYSFHMYHF